MSARHTARRRGQPLLALILLMISWVGARAAMWEQPKIVHPAEQAKAATPAEVAKPLRAKPASAPRIAPSDQAVTPRVLPPAVQPAPVATPGDAIEATPTAPALGAASSSAIDTPIPHSSREPGKRMSTEVAAGHQELYSAGMSMPTIDEGNAVERPRTARLPSAAALVQPAGSRWSMDAWLVLRDGSNGFNAPGAGLPGVVVPVGFYGGSQAGAVLRYRLAPSSALSPTLYLRGTSGLEYPRGEELAAGLSIKPLRTVPIAIMAEGRVTRTTSGTIVRPAVAAVTLLPPARLPGGLRGEAYAQAGFVGGRDATAFVDGQARIEKPLVRSGRVELRAGGGVWGGAQEGASRLDVGPSATLAVPIGPGGARLSADYRFRVAGQAAPGSGAVLTLSAGF